MMLVAVAAMGFTACSKDVAEEVNPEVQTITRELIVSAEKPVLEGDTRTEFNGETVVWSTNDAIRMVYQSENGWSTKFYASKSAHIEGNKATFAVDTEFPANAGGNYQFYAGYPTKQWNKGTANYSEKGTVDVEIPTEQTMPSANTFDSKGDLLIGKSVATYATIPAKNESMNFNYTRLVSHARVTLKNFVAEVGEEVLKVTFTAPAEVCLTGSSTADFETQALTKDFDNNTVTVSLPENKKPAATENVDVWFCSAPATIGEGENLTVEVETTRGTYTRTITAREGGIQFPQNKYSTLGINMASAEFVAATVESLKVTGATIVFTTEDDFVFDGTVTATLSNGYEQNVTALAIVNSSNVNMDVPGTYTVTVSYGDKETSYEVTVQSASDEDQEVTITFDGTQGQKDGLTWTSNPITVVANTANGGANAPYEHADKHLRFYTGNTLTFSGATITKIVFNLVSGRTGGLSADVGNYSLSSTTGTWVGSAESVTFTTTSQARINSVTITYSGAGGGGEEPEPTPDPEEPEQPEQPDPGTGDEVTATFAPRKVSKSNTTLTDDQNNSWVFTSDANSFTTTSPYVHAGSNKKSVSHITFDSNINNVTKVTVNAAAKANSDVTIKVYIGEELIGTSSVLSNTQESGGTPFTVENTENKQGSLKIVVSRPSAANGAIYFNKAEVTYTK